MKLKDLEILHQDGPTKGGFASMREHRLVTGKKLWVDRTNPEAWDDIDNLGEL